MSPCISRVVCHVYWTAVNAARVRVREIIKV